MRISAAVVGIFGMVLAAGASAQDAPAAGQVYVAETFGDWELRCITPQDDAQARCNLYQLLNNSDNAPVAEISLFALPEGGEAVAGANVTAPLETLLTQQLAIRIGENEPRFYPFSYCNAGGCIARIGLTQTDVDLMSAGDTAVMRLVPAAAPEQEVLLTLSLAGFTAGYEAVRAAP